jgi:hypothetical protein
MATTIVLVHSPLVGPGSWTRVAALLAAHGRRVLTPDCSGALRGDPPYYPKLIACAAGALAGDDRSDKVFLAVHSGAGGFLPSVAQAVRRDVAGLIYVDALLPHPGKSWFSTAPAGLTAHLRSLARDGRLPPWHEWWPSGAIQALLPDRQMHARFVADLESLPLDFFEEPAPELNPANANPSAYLQLSAGCKPDADQAEAQGWPVRRLALHHLALLTRPSEIASELDRLIDTF